jgi:hypothetical protein
MKITTLQKILGGASLVLLLSLPAHAMKEFDFSFLDSLPVAPCAKTLDDSAERKAALAAWELDPASGSVSDLEKMGALRDMPDNFEGQCARSKHFDILLCAIKQEQAVNAVIRVGASSSSLGSDLDLDGLDAMDRLKRLVPRGVIKRSETFGSLLDALRQEKQAYVFHKFAAIESRAKAAEEALRRALPQPDAARPPRYADLVAVLGPRP